MNPPQLIIFDCDGVLVDSEAISNRVVAEELNKVGFQLSVEESIQLFAGTSMTYIKNYYLTQTGRPAPEDFEENYRRRSFEAFQEELQAVKGIEEVLEKLALPRCVASNGPLHKVSFNLQLTGLVKYFEGRMFSAYDIQKWKPEPDLYLHAAATMGFTPADCLVVEDSVAGVQAAKAAGIRVLGYAAMTSADKLQAAGAPTFQNMAHLPALISSNNY